VNSSFTPGITQAGGDRAGVELGVRIAAGGELLVPGSPGPVIAAERSVVLQPGAVQVGGRAVEAGEKELVAAHLAGQEAMVAGRRQDGAGDALERLYELGHARARAAVVVGERDGPAPGHVGVVGERRLEEAPGLAELGRERQHLPLAAGPQQRHLTLELAAPHAGGERVLEARHPRGELPLDDLDLGDAQPLLAVHEVQHDGAVLARDVEPEGQLAGRQLERGPVAAGLQLTAARAAAAREGDGHQQYGERGERSRAAREVHGCTGEVRASARSASASRGSRRRGAGRSR
jgi:hypothetical protein